MAARKGQQPAGFEEETISPEDVGEVNAAELQAAAGMNDEWGAVPDDWEEESTGFPPYWSPGEGKSFRARILLVDTRQQDFTRFVCVNAGKFELMCANGPTEEAEPVIVKPGEQFTLSDYHGLPLALLLGQEVLVRAEKKRKTSTPGQSVWIWKLKLAPAVRAMLHERKNQLALRAAAQAQQLEAAMPSPGTTVPEKQPAAVSAS